MALDMSNATYARSTSGAKKLRETSFANDIAKLRKAVSGDKYRNIKTVVEANWVGADADDFKKDIDSARSDILDKISKLQKWFDTAITEEAKEFASFQSRNITK